MPKPNLIELQPPVDRAVLVAAPRRGSTDEKHAEDHLLELARLVDTAGATVVGTLVQRVDRPSPNLYIGAGKADELQRSVLDREASIVVFDEELSPVQGKNLEAALKVRVMDRAEVILDIFATRARTREARMQVELAQLEYLLPRLARMWVHLSRIRGGIGLRGPGETQLETDRRLIRRKISQLKRKLEKVASHRETIRQGRREVPTAALIGYTNAGKSSVLRALTGADAFVEDRLFATLDTLTREAFVAPNDKVRLIDTVGFIRKLPHHLVASFRATLEEVRSAELLLHVIDASHGDWEEHVNVVDTVLDGIVIDHTPVVHVFNKIDRVEDAEQFAATVKRRFEEAVCVSAARGEVDEVKVRLRTLVNQNRRVRSAASN